MQGLLQELDGSPLRKFYSLESNLKRERRVFTIVIVLLVCAALSIAAMTVTGLFQTAFRQEEQSARIHEKEVVDVFLQRRMMLTTASLVLQLRMNGAPSALNVPAPNACTPMAHNVRDDAILRESCDYTVQLLANSGQTPSVEMVTADGSVGYGYLFPTGDLSALRSSTPSNSCRPCSSATASAAWTRWRPRARSGSSGSRWAAAGAARSCI